MPTHYGVSITTVRSLSSTFVSLCWTNYMLPILPITLMNSSQTHLIAAGPQMAIGHSTQSTDATVYIVALAEITVLRRTICALIGIEPMQQTQT